MNKFSKTVMCMAAVVSCAGMLCVTAPAVGVETISIGSTTDTWPTAPYLQTFDPTLTADSGNGVNGARQVGSSFKVSDTVSASSVYFEMQDENDGLFNLSLYEVDDVADFIGRIPDSPDPPAYGTLLAQGTSLPDSAPPNTGITAADETIIRFDFATPVVLEPRGVGGYVFVFSSVSGSRTISNGQTADITAGASTAGGGSFSFLVNVDGVIQPFALEAVIPEPASLALLGLGGLMMLRRRQG